MKNTYIAIFYVLVCMFITGFFMLCGVDIKDAWIMSLTTCLIIGVSTMFTRDSW